MADLGQELIKRAVETREQALTPLQRARRAKVTRRNAVIAAGAKRGVNAPKDLTFGGVRKDR